MKVWRALAWLPLLAALLAGSGCAMVKVSMRGDSDYVELTRGDILSTGGLSERGMETLRVAGIEPKPCRKAPGDCATRLQQVDGVGDERRLAAQSELWVAEAMARDRKGDRKTSNDAAVEAWLEAARHAYAYLFFTERTPGERAFENRQTQVRDYYNYAVQQVGAQMFRYSRAASTAEIGLSIGAWHVDTDASGFRLPGDTKMPEDIYHANGLIFGGLRSNYRRDGFGAEVVAKVPPSEIGDPTAVPSEPELSPAATKGARREHAHHRDFSEIPYAPATALLRFPGNTLAEVLTTWQATLVPYDPYRKREVVLHGQRVPLAANFTAAYGLWLAQSGFAQQSVRSMLGHEHGIDRPHLYLMQPYDPDRRVLLMLHGLASSPEAWVNLANEVMGDEALREHYQIWQVYYPTNLPIPVNRERIATLLQDTLRHFDPSGQARASHDMVLIGHSMGGVIGRLLLSSSQGDRLWDTMVAERKLSPARIERVRTRVGPLLHFEPLPQVNRAIFLAAPQHGTEMAEGRLGRLIGNLIRLPLTLLEGVGDVLQDLAGLDNGQAQGKKKSRVPNAIDNLRDTDPFIRATASLSMPPSVRYHTIIGRHTGEEVPLAESNDGVVPYSSAHMDGAESEKVINSWHSVQETPEAILEIRRILHEQMAAESSRMTQ